MKTVTLDSHLKAINTLYTEAVQDHFLINIMKTSLCQSEKVACNICSKKYRLDLLI